MSQKDQTIALLKSIETGEAGPAASINPAKYIQHNKIHLVLGQGNFVLVQSEGSLGGKPTSFYDLFRVETSKIAEHWDTIETIPAKSAWKNNNSKF